MRIEHADLSIDRGWFVGPWNADINLSIGYAITGIDEPHLHAQVTEFYLVARGKARVRVGQQTVEIASGDLLQVDPGEAHTFLSSSEDYLHFVINWPGLTTDLAQLDKSDVPHELLGL